MAATGALVAPAGEAGAAAAGALVAAIAVGAAGSFQLAPALLTMNTTARSISISARSGLPPRGGMARIPVIACWNVNAGPCAITLAHAALSPTLCAPASPVSWQVLHTGLNT